MRHPSTRPPPPSGATRAWSNDGACRRVPADRCRERDISARPYRPFRDPRARLRVPGRADRGDSSRCRGVEPLRTPDGRSGYGRGQEPGVPRSLGALGDREPDTRRCQHEHEEPADPALRERPPARGGRARRAVQNRTDQGKKELRLPPQAAVRCPPRRA